MDLIRWKYQVQFWGFQIRIIASWDFIQIWVNWSRIRQKFVLLKVWILPKLVVAMGQFFISKFGKKFINHDYHRFWLPNLSNY